MQKHVKVYLDYHGYDCQEDVVCEECGCPAVEIHHKIERSVCPKYGIDKDRIENLAGLCRKCHDDKEVKARLKKECFKILKGLNK